MTTDNSLATGSELWFRNKPLPAVHVLKTYLLAGDTSEQWLGMKSILIIDSSMYEFIAAWGFRRWNLVEVGHWGHTLERHILFFAFQVSLVV